MLWYRARFNNGEKRRGFNKKYRFDRKMRQDTHNIKIVSVYRQLQGNGTLEFPAFASQFYRSDVHDQIYRCQASNQGGTIISRNIRVRGVVHEFFAVKVDGSEVLLNNVAFLKCAVPVHVREYVEVTSWYRGEEILTDNSDISEYSFSHKNHLLRA